jgi:hypothetical protein
MNQKKNFFFLSFYDRSISNMIQQLKSNTESPAKKLRFKEGEEGDQTMKRKREEFEEKTILADAKWNSFIDSTLEAVLLEESLLCIQNIKNENHINEILNKAVIQKKKKNHIFTFTFTLKRRRKYKYKYKYKGQKFL